jgi:serine/threonine protein kinase/ankyrin repeat protein
MVAERDSLERMSAPLGEMPRAREVREASLDYLTTQSFFQPGALIAERYEAVCTLGTGGMGSVIKVIDRALDNETIALKLLYPHHAQDPTVFARFRNEVLIARRLSHPNIVRIYDFGQAGQGYYFVTMEYVSGGCLSRYIYDNRRDTPLLADVLRILCEIAEAMDHAHRAGVVHRDLKPDNILLTDRGEIKITDFGLARTMYADRNFTEAGETVGTPYYMSPEQLCGDKVDGRSDIYSFGLIAYEMVVGRRAFFEQDYMLLAAQHLKQPLPDFASKESGIPSWFEKVVKKCAEKKAVDRYQSFGEIAAVLSEQLVKLDSGSRMRRAPAVLSLYSPPGSQSRRKSPIGFAMGVVIGMLILGAGDYAAHHPVIRGNIQQVLRRVPGFSATVPVREPREIFAGVSQGDASLVQQLLSSGVDVNFIGENQETPLHVALKNAQYEIAQLLVEEGADVNAKNSDGMTPLLFVAREPASAENLRFAQELLRGKVRTSDWDLHHRTALMIAAESGNVAVLQAIIGSDATSNSIGPLLAVQDDEMRTALMYAVRGESLEALNYLLSLHEGKRFDVGLSLQDKQGRTALFYAAGLEEGSFTEALLKAGLDPLIKDRTGNRAISYAKQASRKLLAARSKS